MTNTRFRIGDNVSVKCFDSKKHSICFYKVLSIDKNKYCLIDAISHRKKDITIERLDLTGNLEYNFKGGLKWIV